MAQAVSTQQPALCEVVPVYELQVFSFPVDAFFSLTEFSTLNTNYLDSEGKRTSAMKHLSALGVI
jgi:hypothetical protein